MKSDKKNPVLSWELLDACLPQLQCGRCGFNGCAPYAQAISEGTAPINRCAPGGKGAIEALAKLCHTPLVPPEPQTLPSVEWNTHRAFIEEDRCIGCTLCLRACPTDAIVGAIQQLHTVIEKECTGCRLCEPVCPTQCITILPNDSFQQIIYPEPQDSTAKDKKLGNIWNPNDSNHQDHAAHSRSRYATHLSRKQQAKALAQKKQMQQEIKEAIQRVRQKKFAQQTSSSLKEPPSSSEQYE